MVNAILNRAALAQNLAVDLVLDGGRLVREEARPGRCGASCAAQVMPFSRSVQNHGMRLLRAICNGTCF